jgi:hypothetical protein
MAEDSIRWDSGLRFDTGLRWDPPLPSAPARPLRWSQPNAKETNQWTSFQANVLINTCGGRT